MPEPAGSLLQPVDDSARKLAKTLIRSARHGSLGTLEAGDGSPAVSRVGLATSMDGAPIFLISRLSGHFGNLERDPRCSLLVGEPGKGDPLAHARLTVFGRAVRVNAGLLREHVRRRYLGRHPKAELYADFGDFAFWRIEVGRIALNAGFGRAFQMPPQDVLVDELLCRPFMTIEADAIVNVNAADPAVVDQYAAAAGHQSTGWRLAGIDPEGLDLSKDDATARLCFDRRLTTVDELRPALDSLGNS